jgi:hypothetical protein
MAYYASSGIISASDLAAMNSTTYAPASWSIVSPKIKLNKAVTCEHCFGTTKIDDYYDGTCSYCGSALRILKDDG